MPTNLNTKIADPIVRQKLTYLESYVNYLNSLISGGGGGSITAVTGTANRITSSGGTAPAIDISATFEALLLKKANNLSELTSPSTAVTNLGATTVGANFLTLTNPTAITFPRINANNTVTALDAASFRAAIGSGDGSTNFSVSFDEDGSGDASGATFNGSSGVNVSYNTIGAQKLLVSGSNIKTINSGDIVGTGNLQVGDALVANTLAQFASTTSLQLKGVISDETGSGALVFGTNPTLGGMTITDATNIVLNSTTGTKIGTATTQKLSFYNSTPIVQPTGNALTALSNLGLIASPTLAESDITSLTSDLAAKAPLASPTFTGTVTIPNGGVLGTPTSVTLTNGTGLPIGGVTGLGTGVATFLATPSSANLATAMTDKTGTSGTLVFSIAPTFTGTSAMQNAGVGGVNTTTRTTNGGSNVSTIFGVAANGTGVTAGDKSFSIDGTTSNFNLCAGNGTRIVQRAFVGLVTTSNTANSEDGILTFGTMTGGTIAAERLRITAAGGFVINSTQTAGGTTGAQTINKPSGSVNFAASATTLVVTNSLVTTASNIFIQVHGTDTTFTFARVTPGSGSFTITANAAATAETRVSFYVIN